MEMDLCPRSLYAEYRIGLCSKAPTIAARGVLVVAAVSNAVSDVSSDEVFRRNRSEPTLAFVLAREVALGRLRPCRRGEIIFSASRPASSVYLVASGLIRLYRLSASGGEAGCGYVGAGEVFGESCCFGEPRRQDFAEAVTQVEIVEIPGERFQQEILGSAALSFEVARQLFARLDRIESRFEALALHEVPKRIAHALLQLVEQFGCWHRGRLVIDLPLTQSHLAALAGTSRQTANLHLRALERSGCIERLRNRIVILDRRGLSCGGDEPGDLHG
jgi:CRP-like cAMP-binding protein